MPPTPDAMKYFLKNLDLSKDELLTLARNSFTGSFLGDADKAKHLAAIDAYA